MPEGYVPDRLYFGVSNGCEVVGDLMPLDGTVSIEADEPFYECSERETTLHLPHESPTVHIDLASGVDVTALMGILPGTRGPVALMFEQRRTYRALPRTVREAKARRKGDRGNPRRRMVTEELRTILPNARVVCDDLIRDHERGERR